AFASRRSKLSAGVGFGLVFGTFTAGNFGHSGMSFWSAAHCNAVWRNCSRTLTEQGVILPLPPRPGSFRRPAAKAETVRSVMDRSDFGLQTSSNNLKTLR